MLSTELAPRELAAGGLAAGAITGLAAVAGWPARSGGGGAAGARVATGVSFTGSGINTKPAAAAINRAAAMPP